MLSPVMLFDKIRVIHDGVCIVRNEHAAAQSLSKHKGGIWFHELHDLSDAALDHLSQYEGQICCEDPAEWAKSMRGD